ncbi:prolyl oligopeptidase family serine peptidase [Opitutaceae bacterium]|nr:prolyl oligopeptidase family serine peptidase [Opitutaceae bacterium]
MPRLLHALFGSLVLVSAVCSADTAESQLKRVSYSSEVTGKERDYFVHLPKGFSDQKSWPVIFFLHGNGERGDGKEDLDYVLKHGPLYEAWIQKRDLPFVIVAPQLPLFGQGKVGYIRNRSRDEIPQRLAEGTPPRPKGPDQPKKMQGQLAEPSPHPSEGLKEGWPLIESELMAMLEKVREDYRGDPARVYLTGLSYGGFGTWYLAAKYPEKFAAIAPVVGYGHVDHAEPLAKAKLPVWQFAGGKDGVVPVRHFYDALNALQERGHPEVRFTIEGDQGHSAWVRVYAGGDLYRWFLSHALPR